MIYLLSVDDRRDFLRIKNVRLVRSRGVDRVYLVYRERDGDIFFGPFQSCYEQKQWTGSRVHSRTQEWDELRTKKSV